MHVTRQAGMPPAPRPAAVGRTRTALPIRRNRSIQNGSMTPLPRQRKPPSHCRDGLQNLNRMFRFSRSASLRQSDDQFETQPTAGKAFVPVLLLDLAFARGFIAACANPNSTVTVRDFSPKKTQSRRKHPRNCHAHSPVSSQTFRQNTGTDSPPLRRRRRGSYYRTPAVRSPTGTSAVPEWLPRSVCKSCVMCPGRVRKLAARGRRPALAC